MRSISVTIPSSEVNQKQIKILFLPPGFILIERRHLNREFKKKKNWMPSFSEGQTLSDKSLSHFAALPISALILSAKIDQ